MVQIVENLTTMRGRIDGIAPSQELADYDDVTMTVESTEPVPGKADLLSSLAGTTAPILIRRELLGTAGPGDMVAFRASRTSTGRVMAEPHPDPGAFAVVGTAPPS